MPNGAITDQNVLLDYLENEATKLRLAPPLPDPYAIYGNLCHSPIPDHQLDRWLDVLPGLFPKDQCCGRWIDYMPVEMYLYIEVGIGGDLVIDYVVRMNLSYMMRPNDIRITKQKDGSLRATSTKRFERDFDVGVDVTLKGRPLDPSLRVALVKRRRLLWLGSPTMRTPALPAAVLQMI